MTNRALTPAQRVAALSPTQRALLSRRLLVDAAASLTPAIPVQSRAAREFPLSHTQQRLWFLQQLEADSSVLNMPGALRWRGPLDHGALQSALDELVRRHEPLRTTFKSVDGTGVQVIGPAENACMPLRTIDIRDRSLTLEHVLAHEAARPFDLLTGPVARALLVQSADDDHVLLVTVHHIVSDGGSARVMTRELLVLYASFRDGKPSPLEPLTVQYADFASWQHTPEQVASLQRSVAYWRDRLHGIPAVLEVPTDRPRRARQSFAGARTTELFDAELTHRLTRLGQNEGATLFMVLLAAFDVLLARFTGQTDIVVGSHVAGRTLADVRDIVGCFINTLALRTDLSSQPTFRELLERVKQTCMGAYAHQDVPFDRLVEELRPERDPSRNPLVQVVVGLQDSPALPQESPVEVMDVHHGASVYDLGLSMFRLPNGAIRAVLEYNTDLYEAATARRLLGAFRHLLEQVLINPDSRIRELQAVPEADLRQILDEWNATTTTTYPRDTCFDSLFRQQVAASPDAPAACDDCEEVTYLALDARAERMAGRLRHLGIGTDAVVPLLGERRVGLLSAMLAVFKAGGAYLPLDPHIPAVRLAHIIQETGARVVVVDRDLRTMLEDALSRIVSSERPGVLTIDDARPETSLELGRPATRRDNLAYVIYTSGSTGSPKGVMVQHGGMLNHLYAKIADLRLTQGDVVAQTAPQSFDIAVWQFLAPLLVGGCVRIYADEITHDPPRLMHALERDGVSIVELVPSVLCRALEAAEGAGAARIRPRQLAALRYLLVTGEALPPATCRRWFAQFPSIPLLNAYGPTECSDDVTHQVIDAAPDVGAAVVPIGGPIANTRIYVLDQHLRPVPVGVPGELHIGGDGVGRGYLNQPDLTAERFIPNQFGSEPGERLYRTGDLVRWRTDGRLEFLGRLDHQVKVRGFRIELGEIETALRCHPGVRDAALAAREDRLGDKRLVAYVVPDHSATPSTDALRSHLRNLLPEYMQPSAFVRMETLPLSSNGKVDRRALPAPDLADQAGPHDAQPHVAARTPLEHDLATIWADLLDLPAERISIHDNFFELGGHSLMATQLLAHVRDSVRIEVPLRQVFESPTLAELAEAIETLRWVTSQHSGRLPEHLGDAVEEGIL